jgi:ABC-type glycerol-3-phosphate transport system permease component
MMAQISLKTNADFIRRPFAPQWPGPAALGNWRHAADLVLPYVTNTVFVAVLGTAGSLCLSLLGAYFFARRPMPGRRVLWAAFLALMLMPGVVNLVPLFALVKRLDLLNSLWALVLLAIAGGQVFQLYILRGFIEDLPRDLFDAAEIDGASHARQVCHIVVPLSGSILGTLAILQFLGLWNDFMMPLIILRDPELFTMGVGLIYLQNEYVRDWGRLMASYCVASLPLVVLFLLAMRLFVRGLTAVALKG